MILLGAVSHITALKMTYSGFQPEHEQQQLQELALQKSVQNLTSTLANPRESFRSATYEFQDNLRCQEIVGNYPVGGKYQSWSTSLMTQAESWCSANSGCAGYMVYTGTHSGACNDWCGRPQFCSSASTLASNSGWNSFLKPTTSTASTDTVSKVMIVSGAYACVKTGARC